MKAVWDLKAQFGEVKSLEMFDCLVAEFLLSEGRYAPTEEQVYEKYRVSSLDDVMGKQLEEFEKFPDVKKLYYEVEFPLVAVLSQMEKTGIVLDIKSLRTIGEKVVEAVAILEKEIFEVMGETMNLNSSQQVGNYLADKQGVPLGKTKTGKYATNEQELAKYAADFPLIQRILYYRELKKLHSTYIESLITKVDETGRVHTTYHQTAVSTGRLASTNPNLQNIPINSDFGRQIKSCFMASEGKTLISCDYSQQELRILAHLTSEEKLIAAFSENLDVHKITASQIFSVTYDKVTKEQRQVGKTINFGIIYGMSSFGMSEGLRITVDEAQKFINAFYETYPKIRSYYDTYLKDGLKNDVVTTLLGRRRYVKMYPQQKFMDNATRRVLMNYPIQGTAADLMKLAMVKIHKEILLNNPHIHLLLQIHDDLVFEVPDEEKIVISVAKEIALLMRDVYPLAVPMEVDIKVGKRWGELLPLTS